ncbi:MAG: hypothetical protein RQ723_12765 [Desulfuromonadales bacterium]|nr:hypothetical protein [Desulfuromonadales bacterium]
MRVAYENSGGDWWLWVAADERAGAPPPCATVTRGGDAAAPGREYTLDDFTAPCLPYGRTLVDGRLVLVMTDGNGHLIEVDL